MEQLLQDIAAGGYYQVNFTAPLRAKLPGASANEGAMGDVFGALFPCGSIPSAPKLQAMRAIHAQAAQHFAYAWQPEVVGAALLVTGLLLWLERLSPPEATN